MGKKMPGNSSGIIGFVDVYNKPYTIKVLKQNDTIPTKYLSGAHFALYKQVYSNIYGYTKSRSPMVEYADIITGIDGLVSIVSADEDKLLKPGTYYLTETVPPLNYSGMVGDIVFSISDLGVFELISTPEDFAGSIDYTDNIADNTLDYVFIIPNEKIGSNVELAISKTVTGNFGNKFKDFDFTITLSSSDPNAKFDWSKNGKEQSEQFVVGDNQCTMRHDDVIVIDMPVGTEVTVTESLPTGEAYITTFNLNDGGSEETDSKSFVVTEDSNLVVTNAREGIVPTGVWMPIGLLLGAGAAFLICIVKLRRRGKRLKRYIREDD